ncbi:MAG TPA: FAD-dependent monooxygenase [Pseudonocardiaceae bacterium]
MDQLFAAACHGAHPNIRFVRSNETNPRGLGEVVDTLGFETPTMAFHTGAGRKLFQFDHGRLPDGTVSRTIKRADLYQALRDTARREGATVEYGKRLADAEITANGVTAHFTDGTTATGDLLIGADGVNSRTRTITDPNAPATCVQGAEPRQERTPHLDVRLPHRLEPTSERVTIRAGLRKARPECRRLIRR